MPRPATDPGISVIPGNGTYVLHLELRSEKRLTVGKLGPIWFGSGRYAYVGRAFGPGGLAARLAHHLRVSASPHWHIDWLRPHAVVQEIWYARTAPSDEHEWALALAQIRGATRPARGFGSSDCACRAHLIHFTRAPSKVTLRRQLERLTGNPPPPIHRFVIP